jgi:hypothetical protein
VKLLRSLFLGSLGVCLLAPACGRIDTEVGAERLPDAASPDAPPARSIYLEAESGLLTGFTIEEDPAASNGEYILPPPGIESKNAPGGATAEYAFTLGSAATYLLWARIHAPGASNNSFWIAVDGEPPYLWYLSTGVIWYWGPVTHGTDYGHPVQYPLAAGPHRLVVYNAVPDVSLDRLYITTPGDVPPGNTTPCDPPHSIQLADGGCEPSCGSYGKTTCGAACAGQTALYAYDCAVCCFAPSDAGAD